MTDRDPRDGRLLPALTLVLLLVAVLAGWLLFPKLHAYVSEQDCIASGRTNCVVAPAQPAP